MDKSREQFEAWFDEETGWETTEYPNREVVVMLWQASRENITPDYTHYECPGCGAAYLDSNVRCDCGNSESLIKHEYVKLGMSE